MAKKSKKEQAADEAAAQAEEIVIEEEDLLEDGEGKSWTEEFQMAGEEVLGFIKSVFREANVRRVTVKNKEGRTLIDIPVVVGLIGLLPQVLVFTLVGLGVAVLSECTVSLERVETEAAEAAE